MKRSFGKPAAPTGKFIAGSRKLYNTLVIFLHCMGVSAPRHAWRQRMKELIARHRIPVASMGFPADWAEREISRGEAE